MGLRVMDGGEGGHAMCGGGSQLGTVGFDTTNPRLGLGSAYAITYTGAQQGKDLGTGLTNVAVGTASYLRFYIRFAALPVSNDATILNVFSGSNALRLKLMRTTGALALFDLNNVQIGSASSGLSLDTWHRVEVGWTINTSTTGFAELRVNGSVVTSSTTSDLGTASGRPIIGNPVSQNIAGFTLLMDDILYQDASGSDHNSWAGDSKILTLLPVSENSVHSNWLKPGGGNTNRHTSIDNAPPVCVAQSTNSGDAEKQIYNVGTDATSNADINMQSYTAVGIDGGATIKSILPYAITGSSSATDTPGAIAVISNPNQGTETSVVTFDNGVAGTFPTGYKCTAFAGYQNMPTVVKGNQPVLRVGKRSTSNRSCIIGQMGIMVEFVPDVTVPTINLTSSSTFKMSDETGKDSYSYSFSANEDIQAWKVKVVSSSSSLHTEGTQIESGGSVSSGTPITGSVTQSELVAAGGAEGNNIVKFFAQDLSGNWST